MTEDKAAAFAGTLAEFYDRYLVPMMFAPYAEIVADRAKGLLPRRVLETAAGSGIVTEARGDTPSSCTASRYFSFSGEPIGRWRSNASPSRGA